MILLTSTSDLIRVTTGSAGSVKVHASWVDSTGPTTFTPGRTNTAAITTAATTTVVAGPSTGQRALKAAAIRNDHASTANVVTIEHFDGTTASVLFKGQLAAGESVAYEDSSGWQRYDASGNTVTIQTTAIAGDVITTVGASGAATSFNISNNGVADITLTASCTLSITGATAGVAWAATIILRQDGTGSRLVSWPGSTKWAAGAAPVLSTAASAVDIVSILTIDGGTSWFGFLGGKAFA